MTITSTTTIANRFSQMEKYHNQLIELAQYVSKNESSGMFAVLGPNEHAPDLIGKKIDRELLTYLSQQFTHELATLDKRVRNLQSKVDRPSKKKVSVVPEKAKKDKVDRVSFFSLPFFVSDVTKEFFSEAKLGVANLSEYKKGGHPEAQYVNGSDDADVKRLMERVSPGTAVTTEVLEAHNCKTFLKLLFDSSVINNRNLGSLFQIYQRTNGLDAGKMKLKVDDHLAKNLLDKKVDWLVAGKRLIEDSEIAPRRVHIDSIIKKFNAASVVYKETKKDCKWWKEVEASPPKNKKSKGYVLFTTKSYDDLYKRFNEAHLAVIDVLVEATDLVKTLFENAKLPTIEELKNSNNVLELKTPISILRKVGNHGKTFRQVMLEKRSDAFDESGNTYQTLLNLVVSYLRIPEQVSSSRLESKFHEFVKSEAVIKSAVETDLFFKELKSQFE